MQMKDWDECWHDEREARAKIDTTRTCQFGIKALDDATIGILRNDLVVIGSDSGGGKSDLCLNMALHNAQNGKKVALFSIEGGSQEAISRLKWRAMKDYYYASQRTDLDLDYRKWRLNIDKSPAMAALETMALIELKKKIGNRLQIYDFDSTFSLENFTNAINYYSTEKTIKEFPYKEYVYDVDLIIIDHLQYFTLNNPKNEFQEVTEILTKVKEITNFHNIPVVLVSHLRKKEKDRGLPSADDFFGTSNIVKISSLAITISSHSTKDDYSKQLYPTFFRIVKSRTGLRASCAILCNYDFKRNRYEDNYLLYNLAGDKPLASPIQPELLPKWAKGPHYVIKKNWSINE